MLYVREGVDREQWRLLHSLPVFSHSFPLPTIKLDPSGAASQVGEFVHVLGPCASLQRPLLRGWEFLPLPPQPPQVFSVSGLRLYFLTLELWVSRSVAWSTSCSLPTRCSFPHPTIRHLAGFASCRLAVSLLHPATCHHPSYQLDECFFFNSWL